MMDMDAANEEGVRAAAPAVPGFPVFSEDAIDAAAAQAATPVDARPVPSKAGDVIESGVYSDPGDRAMALVYVDFVSDPLLFAVSRGKRGWATLRIEPQMLTDDEKAYAAAVLEKKAFDYGRSAMLNAELMGHIGQAVERGEYEGPGGKRGDAEAQREEIEEIVFSIEHCPATMTTKVIGSRAGVSHAEQIDPMSHAFDLGAKEDAKNKVIAWFALNQQINKSPDQ